MIIITPIIFWASIYLATAFALMFLKAIESPMAERLYPQLLANIALLIGLLVGIILSATMFYVEQIRPNRNKKAGASKTPFRFGFLTLMRFLPKISK